MKLQLQNNPVFFVFQFLFFIPGSSAQSLTGVVYDENKQSMPGGSIYLDGTSMGTVTDENGIYSVRAESKINTLLIASYIGYEPAIIENPFDKPSQIIYLIPKTNALREVVVSAQLFSRKSMLKIFREQFLGTTKSGNSCTIANESDINLHYDKKTNELTANSDNPLVVKNAFLGYDITFELMSFNVGFNSTSINSGQIASSFFAGTAHFKEAPSLKNQFQNRRLKTYLGSQTHFFRNLSRNIWGKEAFELFNGSYPANPDNFFLVKFENGIYSVSIRDAKNPNNLSLSEGFNKSFNLLYNRNEQSGIVFKTEKFRIDEYGNTDAIEQILFSGEMGRYKVGNLLPLDFQP